MIQNMYIDLFIQNQISPNTARVYDQELGRFFHFAREDIENITMAHILQYRNSLRKLLPITVSWKISVIRSFFSFLAQQQVIDLNPAINVKSPRVKRISQYPHFNSKHFGQLVGNINNNFKDMRDHCLYLCMGRLGMRVSEVCSLTLENIDNDPDYPSILIMGKGQVIRSIPALDNISETISAYLTTYPGNALHNSPLFPATSSSARPLTPRAVQYILKRRCKALGITNEVSPHTLRHFALSTLLEEGHDIFSIQNFAGHSQLGTTARYLHNLKQQENYTMNFVRKETLIRKTEVVS